MSATHEDLAMRVLQLERELRELATNVSHGANDRQDLADRITLRSWLKLSAPTFTLLLIGFTLLWNAQQTNTAQLMETSRSLGRLDGAVAGLESTTARLDARMASFDERLASFDERLVAIDQRLGGIDERLAGIDERLGGIDERLASLDENLARFGAAVDRLSAKL